MSPGSLQNLTLGHEFKKSLGSVTLPTAAILDDGSVATWGDVALVMTAALCKAAVAGYSDARPVSSAAVAAILDEWS